MEPIITRFKIFTDLHVIAYIVVDELIIKKVRDVLKPHRGQVYCDK